jgi:endonuclease YncB( thermonuclease family)
MTAVIKHTAMCLLSALGMGLAACGGSAAPGDGVSPLCGAPASSTVLSGTVVAVHDGDTLTLQTSASIEQVRLQGIDAPELAQDFGDAARLALVQQTLNQRVKVASMQRDRYDRVLGLVFRADCTEVNQHMLALGMAWFYTAYACDLDSTRRLRFETAQTQAKAQARGLWIQRAPLAPWIFRNGQDPPAPNC